MANFLNNILNLFKGGAKSVIGIDIGLASVKVVQLRGSSGQAVLETYGELALGPYGGVEVGRATHLPPGKLAEALRDILRESHVTTAEAGVSLPSSSSLVSVLDMPALTQSQLTQMIPLEARKYIPVPITEVTIDWRTIPIENGETASGAATAAPASSPRPFELAGQTLRNTEKVKILVVAIQNEVLSRYRELFKAASINANFFEIEVFSSMRSTIGQDLDPTLIIDFGAASTKLFIIDRGIVRAVHNLGQGSQNLTLAIARAMNVPVAQGEELKRNLGLSLRKDGQEMSAVMTGMLNFVLSEANRAALSYQKANSRAIKKAILVGGGASLIGLRELTEEALGVPTELANPFGLVVAPAFLEPVLRSIGPQFSVALGLALRRLSQLG